MKSTVLILESDPQEARLMANRLLAFGIRVRATSSAEMAMRLVRPYQPDVVVVADELADAIDVNCPTVTTIGVGQSRPYNGKYVARCLRRPFSGNDLLDSIANAMQAPLQAANDPF